MNKNFLLGRMAICVKAAHGFGTYVIEELEPIVAEVSETDVKLEFEFTDRVDQPQPAALYAPFAIGDKRMAGRIGTLEASFTERADRMVASVTRSAGRGYRDLLPEACQRFVDWNYLSKDEQLAKDFMYGVFDLATQVTQLELGQTYVHASSMQRGQCAVLIAGWGGIGKTTTVLKLIAEDGWRYLSDDYAIVDVDGTVYRSPKKMQVYAYNLVGESELEDRLMRHRTWPDRLSWSIYLARRGKNGVRRRVSAEDLYGSAACGCPAQLSHAFMIERSTEDTFGKIALSRNEFANRAAATLIGEIRPLVLTSAASQSAGMSTIFPSIADVYQDTKNVISKAIARVDPVLIKIPNTAGPEELANFMRTALAEC